MSHSAHGMPAHHYGAAETYAHHGPQPHYVEHGFEAGIVHHQGSRLPESPIVDMLNSSAENLVWGRNYLHDHPVAGHLAIRNLIDDTLENILHFKNLQLRGHETYRYLSVAQNELTGLKEKLLERHTEADSKLAEYIDAASHEMHVARYLEEHQAWPDGVPLFDEYGEWTTDVHDHDAHYESAHDYHTYGHQSYMANDIDDVSSAASISEDSNITVNIEGPVIIAGKETDVASLIRQALKQSMPQKEQKVVDDGESLMTL